MCVCGVCVCVCVCVCVVCVCCVCVWCVCCVCVVWKTLLLFHNWTEQHISLIKQIKSCIMLEVLVKQQHTIRIILCAFLTSGRTGKKSSDIISLNGYCTENNNG